MRVEVGRLPELSEGAQAVLVRLLTLGPASRADLSRSLGWSAPTLTRIVRVLEEHGLVIAGDWAAAATQRTGRPSQSLDVNADAVHLVGVKLTDTEMTVARTDMRSRVLEHRSVQLSGTAVDAVVDAVVREVREQLEADSSVAAAGISLAGPVSPRSEYVAISPFLGWTDVPLRHLLQQRLPIPVVVDNDVRALTAAEHWFGAGAGCSDFVLLTVGAGVGCGIVVDDHLLVGTAGGAGQIGHLPISESGPMCESGHRGCARAYLSSAAMVHHTSMALADPGLTFADVLDLARADNPVARRVVCDAGYALGTVIGTLSTMSGPQKVIITGEGAGFVPLVRDLVSSRAREVEHWTLSHAPIQVIPFGFTEWARGAAVVALQQLLTAAVRSGAAVGDPHAVDTPAATSNRRSPHQPGRTPSARLSTGVTRPTDRLAAH